MPICRVPLITSQREEQALITANNMKPVVKLLINRCAVIIFVIVKIIEFIIIFPHMTTIIITTSRHNNKYSYTGASDDNLLKNIELFDKLSLRFSNRCVWLQ